MPCFGYNREEVEILLNCVWLILGLSLFSAWSTHAWRTRSCPPNDLLPSRCLQLTALVVLIALLFPVISLTDDIAMCTAPRDAERALRLHDPVDSSQPAQLPPPSATAWLDLVALMLRSGPNRPIEQEAELDIQLPGTRLPVESRPPPASV